MRPACANLLTQTLNANLRVGLASPEAKIAYENACNAFGLPMDQGIWQGAQSLENTIELTNVEAEILLVLSKYKKPNEKSLLYQKVKPLFDRLEKLPKDVTQQMHSVIALKLKNAMAMI